MEIHTKSHGHLSLTYHAFHRVPFLVFPSITTAAAYLKDHNDRTWEAVAPTIWLQISLNMSVFTACIPSLRGVIESILINYCRCDTSTLQPHPRRSRVWRACDSDSPTAAGLVEIFPKCKETRDTTHLSKRTTVRKKTMKTAVRTSQKVSGSWSATETHDAQSTEHCQVRMDRTTVSKLAVRALPGVWAPL